MIQLLAEKNIQAGPFLDILKKSLDAKGELRLMQYSNSRITCELTNTDPLNKLKLKTEGIERLIPVVEVISSNFSGIFMTISGNSKRRDKHGQEKSKESSSDTFCILKTSFIISWNSIFLCCF
jgi:hypothetical protein